MPLVIEKPYGPQTPEQVADVEAQLGTQFPPEYRSFLEQVGGAKVQDETVPGTDGGLLLKLYSPTDLVKWHVTYGRSSGFLAYIPHDYLMIGGGSGGAPCIRTSGGDEGTVWWADFEKAGEFEEEEPREEIMVRLADDFDGFLALFD